MKRHIDIPRYTNLKEEKNLMKNKNNLLKFTNIVLLITMFAIILVSGTYAKYTSTASGTDATVVANWSFKVNGEDIAILGTDAEFEFKLFDTANIKDSDGGEEHDVADGLIGPGTSGSFEFTVENTSDVTAQYNINFDVTNTNNIPIQFSTDGINYTSELSDIAASDNTILEINSGVKAITVMWKWDFEGDSAIDTALGTATTPPTITVKATITATQVNKNEKTGADGQFKYVELGEDKIQITRYIGDSTSVVIPAEYEGQQVYSVGNLDADATNSSTRYNIFGETNSNKNTTIKSLTISEGIEVIGDAAFFQCSGLTGELILPSTLKSIGYSSFDRCRNLTGDLKIPEGVTYIGEAAFQQCDKMKGTLTLPSTLVTIDDYAFNYCSGLTGDIDIPESVTYIGESAFNKCTGFNGELILRNNLEVIGDFAFNHCSNLINTSVTIPKSVTRIGLNDTDGTHIFYDFANTTMTEYIVEEGNTKFMANSGVLFTSDGTRLIAYPTSRPGDTYEIPEGVTIIDELAFSRAGLYSNDPENCLKKIVLPNSYILTTTLPSNYLNKGNNLAVGIYIYTGVEEVEVKADNPNYKSEDGIVYSKDGTTLWYVPLQKDGDIVIAEGVTTIKGGAFYCGKASDRIHTSITIPASVTEIDETALAELKILGSSKVTFAEGSIFEFKSNGTVGKK